MAGFANALKVVIRALQRKLKLSAKPTIGLDGFRTSDNQSSGHDAVGPRPSDAPPNEKGPSIGPFG
jgi:hypothetical protein